MGTFYCEPCNIIFEDNQDQKKEYRDYIYGPCWKYIAFCPQCTHECSEKRAIKPGKPKKEVPMECGSGSCHNSICGRF